jgi:hypothetical protein
MVGWIKRATVGRPAGPADTFPTSITDTLNDHQMQQCPAGREANLILVLKATAKGPQRGSQHPAYQRPQRPRTSGVSGQPARFSSRNGRRCRAAPRLISKMQGTAVLDTIPAGRVRRRGRSYQGETWILDSSEGVWAGQARSEYPATFVLFSMCALVAFSYEFLVLLLLFGHSSFYAGIENPKPGSRMACCDRHSASPDELLSRA